MEPQVDDVDSATELARSLPQLVAELKKLRVEMDKKTKVYEHLLKGDSPLKASNSGSSLAERPSERQSLFTPMDFGRVSEFDSSGYGEIPEEYGRGSMIGGRPRQVPTSSSMRTFRQCDYTVLWVSGECGISLRNFSSDKVGAQIAVLQHADGVTTGMAHCRLGDQLVTVNDEQVERLRFREIVQKLKASRRPISLGFRTNQNLQTSPRAAFANTAPVPQQRHSTGVKKSSSFRQSIMGGRRSQPQAATRAFFDEDDASAGGSVSDLGPHPDRGTDASSMSTSSTATLSDDVELWVKEQEEMHSGLLVLLTETVLRCEKLQQENLDQLQNLMQLAPVDGSERSTESDATVALPDLIERSFDKQDGTNDDEDDEPVETVTAPELPARRAPPPAVPTMETFKPESLVV